MSKVKYSQISEEEKILYLGEFYDMVSLLSNREEVKNFLKDLLTLSETVMIARRIQIAKRLLKGMTYDEITEEMCVGKTTISQVDRWLNNGFGGYKKILKKHSEMKKFKDNQLKKGDVLPFSIEDMKRKYPAHFLLLNLLSKNK